MRIAKTFLKDKVIIEDFYTTGYLSAWRQQLRVRELSGRPTSVPTQA